MRLWSLHPRYLDAKGLTAVWREALLAQHVLRGATKGYRNHPQLARFRALPGPVAGVAAYLRSVHAEAERRGYHFDRGKIARTRPVPPLPVTQGQLHYELEHLRAKLAVRDRRAFEALAAVVEPEPHPLFYAVPGEIEPWERIALPPLGEAHRSPMPTKPAFTPSMSDEAVRAKTGKTWNEWFALLDRAGAKKMDHKQIVAVLNDQHGVGPWWRQMVTVTYEQARGLRAKHETTSGFQVSASRTINAPASAVFKAWHDGRARARWLGAAGLTVRKATPDKSLRITWTDGATHVDVELYPKGEAKTQVALQHSKLPDAAAVERLKPFWAEALGKLKAQLEKG